jgi:hypothetical protein
MFEPGVTDINKEDKLAAWSSTSNIDCDGEDQARAQRYNKV